MHFNAPMVRPFRLTYLVKGGGGGGGALEILTIACLTFCLLLIDRPILGLPEYKLKVVKFCKMDGRGGLQVVVSRAFDRFQRYVEITKRSDEKCYNSFIGQFNDLKGTGSA